MELCYAVCCGLDVHKKSVTACLRTPGPHGQRLAQMRTVATTTGALPELADRLTVADCPHVAMESTGTYWRHDSEMLGQSMALPVVNAAHDSKVPGPKADVK